MALSGIAVLMILSQDFQSAVWSVEDDLLVEELVSDADRLLQSRKQGSGTADCSNTSGPHNPNEAVLPENVVELTSLASGRAGDQSDDQVYKLPDLEDIGLVLDRRHFRPAGMNVTDFTGAEWCQQQFALALSAKLPQVRSGPVWPCPPTMTWIQRHRTSCV